MMVALLRAPNGLVDASLRLRLQPSCHTRTGPPKSNPIEPNNNLLACIAVRQSKTFPRDEQTPK
jgi:hypothetical protein